MFQEATRNALAGFPDVLNRSDDVTVLENKQEQHDMDLCGAYDRIREKGLTLRKKV